MTKAASLVLAALVIALAGCGGGSNSSSSSSAGSQAAAPPASAPSSTPSSGSGQQLQVAADSTGQLKFDKTSLSAKAGKVSIAFANSSSVAHNLTVQPASGGTNLGATPTFTGGSKSISLNLKPGKYAFYCSVPGHRQAGMQGTLVVK
jgi:plastocyanin